MTEEETQKQLNWRDSISEPAATLKITNNEVVVLTFKDDGVLRTHTDFGDSIVFAIDKLGEELKWYVNPKNYDLLGQIKALGDSAKDIKVRVKRTGENRSNTRYKVEKVN